MFVTLSIISDIRFAVMDILRGLGMSIVNMIYSTIDTLYEVAQKINSLNFIQMLENVENSTFTKIFNAFFILSFVILLLFSIWKITFRILDADENQQSLFNTIKEIVKCSILIFCTYLIFNSTINIGINLSNAIFNNFSSSSITIGDQMKSAYLTLNSACYKVEGGDSVDKDNVEDLKGYLNGYADLSTVSTVQDFETLIRNGTISSTNVSDSGAFSYRCQIYKKGFFNDGEDYAFNYNYLFGIVVGLIFLVGIGFSVLLLGRRQLELAFLMTIAPLVFATSIERKEQRSALYQQLASLILQSGAMMLLIGLTSIMFNAIQNSPDINSLGYFSKTVAQSVLYLGCAMLLMTGCGSLNRFIGENVAANSGRDMLMAMRGTFGDIRGAGSLGIGTIKASKDVALGSAKGVRGVGSLAKSGYQSTKGVAYGVASALPSTHNVVSQWMGDRLVKTGSKISRGQKFQESSNRLFQAYGRHLEKSGTNKQEYLSSRWDYENDRYNPEFLKKSVASLKSGWQDTKEGFGSVKESVSNISHPNAPRSYPRTKFKDFRKDKK